MTNSGSATFPKLEAQVCTISHTICLPRRFRLIITRRYQRNECIAALHRARLVLGWSTVCVRVHKPSRSILPIVYAHHHRGRSATVDDDVCPGLVRRRLIVSRRWSDIDNRQRGWSRRRSESQAATDATGTDDCLPMESYCRSPSEPAPTPSHLSCCDRHRIIIIIIIIHHHHHRVV